MEDLAGMGRFGGTELTTGEVDAVLEGEFQTNAGAFTMARRDIAMQGARL